MLKLLTLCVNLRLLANSIKSGGAVGLAQGEFPLSI
jgi:hypothetical protein